MLDYTKCSVVQRNNPETVSRAVMPLNSNSSERVLIAQGSDCSVRNGTLLYKKRDARIYLSHLTSSIILK